MLGINNPELINSDFNEKLKSIRAINAIDLKTLSDLREKINENNYIDNKLDLKEVNKIAGQITLKTFGLNFSTLEQASKKSFKKLDEKISFAEYFINEFALNLLKYYGVNCGSVAHFIPEREFNNNKIWPEIPDRDFIKKIKDRSANIGQDKLIFAYPYRIENSQDNKITETEITKVSFKDNNIEGQKVDPKVAFYSMLVAKGFIGIDQIEKKPGFKIKPIIPAIKEESAFLILNGINPSIENPNQTVIEQINANREIILY